MSTKAPMNPIVWAAATFCALFSVAATAADLPRDPTQPPAGALAPAPGAAPAEADGLLSEPGLTIVHRDGKPYVADRGRLYGVGQTLHGYRILAIGESQLVARKGSEVLKLPVFTGVVRRAAAMEQECQMSDSGNPPKTALKTPLKKAPPQATIPALSPCSRAPSQE